MGSLPVANVQALAAATNGSSEIPQRYIRPEDLADPVAADGHAQIPVIDLTKLLDPQFSQQESAKLHLACQEWGFFQLINHRIPSEVIERMKDDITEFFKLPLEKKKLFSQRPGKFEGYGQLFVVSEDQKLDWADMIYLKTVPLPDRSMELWPTQPHTFRAALDNYSSEVYSLASCLLGLMAENLGLQPEAITNLYKDKTQSVRINYYPPCPQADKVLGFSPHSDASLITLVLQVNQVHGLQIKKNGGWLPLKPLSGAFIVNIGDSFEILSNGKYKSIEHRAVVSPDKERLSIAAFHSARLECIGPLPELVGGNEAKYKSVKFEDFVKLLFSAKLDGKSLLGRLRLDGEP